MNTACLVRSSRKTSGDESRANFLLEYEHDATQALAVMGAPLTEVLKGLMEILFSEVWTRLRDSAKDRERPGVTTAEICYCPPAETREGAGALSPGKLQLERDP